MHAVLMLPVADARTAAGIEQELRLSIAAVRDPRGVLEECGLEFPSEVEVRVWDQSAEKRYLVIPQRQKGTERMSEEALAEMVTRDSMVGVAKVEAPRR